MPREHALRTPQPIRLFIADDHALFREGMQAKLSTRGEHRIIEGC
jgi:DNA-binding NarL/FixJ family response regulator